MMWRSRWRFILSAAKDLSRRIYQNMLRRASAASNLSEAKTLSEEEASAAQVSFADPSLRSR
jgi:hypothetical protein